MISSSRSSPTNTQQSSTEVQNLNLQDTDGITLANVSGVNITTSDGGAIGAAVDISSDVISLGRDALRAGESVAVAGLDNAIDSVNRANASIERFAGDALYANSDVITEALDFASGLFGDAISATQKTLDTNLTGLNSLAKQTSASADDRVANVALYAFVALAAVFVLPALLGKMK